MQGDSCTAADRPADGLGKCEKCLQFRIKNYIIYGWPTYLFFFLPDDFKTSIIKIYIKQCLRFYSNVYIIQLPHNNAV